MVVEKLPEVNPPSGRVPGRGLLALPISEALRWRNDGEICDSGSIERVFYRKESHESIRSRIIMVLWRAWHLRNELVHGKSIPPLETLRKELIGTYPGPHLPRVAPRLVPRAFSAIPASAAVDAVTVFFGANDASLPDWSNAFQHVPLPEYRENLRAIRALLRARWPSAAVILVTPPLIDERGRVRHPCNGDASGLPERTNEAAGRYARACVEVAAECGLRTIDVWSRMQEFPGWETAFLRDGLHLTPIGNRQLFEEVVFALRDANLSLEALPADPPLYSDIDPNDAVNRA
ncbi:GDSL esterase/lipase [Hordeum vulgare]|nr:GDSL esterase/lipase [Hordeum vulgare]